MKPPISTEPINLDWLVLLISPNIWNEDVPYKLRWLAMMFLYSLSCVFWYSFLPIGFLLIFNEPISLFPQYLIVALFGCTLGLACWWDFHKAVKKKILAAQASEELSK